MAYSNWGAFVFCNGLRRKDKEDVGVFDTDEASLPSGARIFANILKNREKNNDDSSAHSHHAVLGDHEVRLCGYKNYPALYRFKDGKADQIDLDQYKDSEYDDWQGSIDGYEFEASVYGDNDDMLRLKLKEPDGTEWTSNCGYQYGAGFMDED